MQYHYEAEAGRGEMMRGGGVSEGGSISSFTQ